MCDARAKLLFCSLNVFFSVGFVVVVVVVVVFVVCGGVCVCVFFFTFSLP